MQFNWSSLSAVQTPRRRKVWENDMWRFKDSLCSDLWCKQGCRSVFFVYKLVSSFPVGVLYTTVTKKLISLFENLKSNLIDRWTLLLCCLNSNSWSNFPVHFMKISSMNRSYSLIMLFTRGYINFSSNIPMNIFE